MIKLNQILQEVISKNPILDFGLANDVFNLTKLAKFIQPTLESKTKKEIKIHTIVMALSRVKKDKTKIMKSVNDFNVDKISIFSDLATISFHKTEYTYKYVHKIHDEIISQGKYCTISESTQELTMIFDKSFLKKTLKNVPEDYKYKNENISAVRIHFSEDVFKTPGLIMLLTQHLTFNGINIIEISSTYTELIFYVDDKDLKAAFDALYMSYR